MKEEKSTYSLFKRVEPIEDHDVSVKIREHYAKGGGKDQQINNPSPIGHSGGSGVQE